MKLVTKLLDYVHDAFDKEADQFVALRVRHTSEGFSWRVSDRVLTLYDNGVLLHTISLSQYTLLSLIDYLATLDQITVIYLDFDNSHIAATSLIDGTGYQAQSNGDILYAYQSTLWMYLDALATELAEAKVRIVAMLDQMSVKTADEEWLDEWGGYFGIIREIGESDANYSNRIILEVIRPRGNNKAIEAALLQKYGQTTTVNDIVRYTNPIPNYSGTYFNDGVWLHNADNLPLYGLFQIVIGYDLLTSGAPPAFIQSVRDFVEKFRDAGTHLESVNLSTSEINDTYDYPPVDGGLSLIITNGMHYNGLRYHNGSSPHSAVITNETL